MSSFPVDKEWFKLKLKEKGNSRRGVAKLLGFHHCTISRVILGDAPLRVDQAIALAAYFDVSLYELLRRSGMQPPAEGNTLPVVGALNGAFEVTPRTLPPVTSMPVFEQAALCLICDDPNSLFYGWVYAYLAATDIQPTAIGRLSVVQRATGQKLVCFLTPGLYAGRYNLMFISGRQLLDVEVSAASPVLHIRPTRFS
jgi:transcriptional regulator with XRE-family HTH domain